jgi:surface antigen
VRQEDNVAHPSNEKSLTERQYTKYNLPMLKRLIGKAGVIATVSIGVLGIAEKASADTGNYPWAAADEVYQPTYDWGYIECQAAMQSASTCDTHNKRKPGTNIYYHESDPWRYDVRNCTSYVAWRISQEFGISIPGWGNASNWDIAAHAAGYKVTGIDADKTKAEPGDIAEWDSNHVAFVESVNPDGSVNVAEYNHDEWGDFDTRGENPSQSGTMYKEKVVANHYIDINGVGNSWNGIPGSGSASGNYSYSSIAERQEFYTPDGWIYTKVGGSAWPIKNQGWTPDDDTKWGGRPVGPVPATEVHDHEVGYDANGRNIGVHAPRAGTDVFVDGGSGQQYYFVGDKAFEIGPGEIDDLNVRDKAERIPDFSDRLSDFMQNRNINLQNGTVYRYAGSGRVNQLIYHPDGSRDAYWVNNDTLLSCLGLVQHQPINILPQSSRYYTESAFGVSEISTPPTCSYPPGMVLRGPGGLEQWRITGDNGSLPYTKHLYPNPLLTYLHTSGNPDLETLRSINAINDVPQGSDMAPPDGQFFRDSSSGQVFESTQGQYRPVASADMLTCLGNPSTINVPGEAMVGMPQGQQLSCNYENRIVVRPNGQAYFIKQSKLFVIGNPAIRDCIIAREHTGAPTSTSDQTIDSYVNSGLPAHCAYEDEPGLNFVKENNDPTVWLVHADGTKQHVGSLCVSDAFTTTLKRFHVFTVPAGETAGHRKTADWFASPTDCNNLPG